MSGTNQLFSFEQIERSTVAESILAVESTVQPKAVDQSLVVEPPQLPEPTEPAKSTKPTEPTEPIKESALLLEFSLQKMAYLIDREIRPSLIPTYVLAGTADFKLIINQLRLTDVGDEVLILIRPFTHSMALYLRVSPNKKIICFISDAQASQWQFYPARIMVDILCTQFSDAIEIYVSQSAFQSKDLTLEKSKELNLGSGILAIEMLRYFVQYGERFIQELLHSPCVEFNSEASDKPPHQVKLIVPDVLPAHFMRSMKIIFAAEAESSDNSIPISYLIKRMQHYSVDATVEIMSVEQLHRLQFFGTTPEVLNIETPLLYANRMLIERIFVPINNSTDTGHATHGSNPNYDNSPNQSGSSNLSGFCYRLTYQFANQQDFLYEKNLIFCDAQLPTDVTLSKLRSFMSEKVKIDAESYAFTITTDSLNGLMQILNCCDNPTYLQSLMHEGFTQCAALKRFIAEAKEVVQIYQIKMDYVQGGLGLDCVNRALLYLLANRRAIFVPTEHFNTVDQEQLQAFITSNDVKQYEYVVFSYAVNQSHQIAVMVDYKQKCVKVIDGEGRDYCNLINQHFNFPKDFTVINTPAFRKQEHHWSCGINVILNILNELQVLNNSIVDLNNIDQILRIIIRSSEYIALERLRLSAQQQKQQRMAACLLQHPQVKQDNTLCDSLVVPNKSALNRAGRSRSTDLMEVVTGMSSFMIHHEPEHRIIITRILANLPTEQDYDLSFQAIYRRERDLGYELNIYWGSSLDLILQEGHAAAYFLSRVIDELMSSDNWPARFNAEFERNKGELVRQAEEQRNSAELKPPSALEQNKGELTQRETFTQQSYLRVFMTELAVEKMVHEYQFHRGLKSYSSRGEPEYIVPLTVKYIIFKLIHVMVTKLDDYRNRAEHGKTNCLVVDRKQLEYSEDKLQRYYIEQLTERLDQEQSLPCDLKLHRELIARLCLPGARSVVFKFEALRWKAEFINVLHIEMSWLEQAVFQNMASHIELISALPLSVQFFTALVSSTRFAQADDFLVKNQTTLTLALSKMSALQLFRMMLVIPLTLRLSTLQKLAELLTDPHPLKATLTSLIAIYRDNPQPENQFHSSLFVLFEQELKTFQDVITAIMPCHKSVRFLYLKQYHQQITSFEQLWSLMPLVEPHHLLGLTQLKHDLILSTSEVRSLLGYFAEADRLPFVLRFFDNIAQHPLDSICLLVTIHRIDTSCAEQRFKLHLPLILQHIALHAGNNIQNDYPQLFHTFRHLFVEGLLQYFHLLHGLQYERLLELLKLLSNDGQYIWEQRPVIGAAAEAVCDLAIKARDLCTNVSHIVSVITILPDTVKYRYLEAIQDKITAGNDVMHIVHAMPATDQLATAKKLQHLIKNEEQLDRVFRVLNVPGDERKLIISMADKEFNNRPVLCVSVMEKLYEYELKPVETTSQATPEQYFEKFVTKNMALLLDELLVKELTRSVRKILDQHLLLFIVGLLQYADTLQNLTTERMTKFKLPDNTDSQLAIELLHLVRSHAQMKVFYHLIPEQCNNHIISLLSKCELISDDIVIILYSFCQFKFASSTCNGEKVAEYFKEKFELFSLSQRVECALAMKQKLEKLIIKYESVLFALLEPRQLTLQTLMELYQGNLQGMEKYSDAMFFVAALSVINPYFDKAYHYSASGLTNTKLNLFKPISYAAKSAHYIVRQLQQGELPLFNILRNFQRAKDALTVDALMAYFIQYILISQPISPSNRSNGFWSTYAKMNDKNITLSAIKNTNNCLLGNRFLENVDLYSIYRKDSIKTDSSFSILALANNSDLYTFKSQFNKEILKKLMKHPMENDNELKELLLPIRGPHPAA